MITGTHSIIYSATPEEDRAFLRDVLKFHHVDVGGSWLIWGQHKTFQSTFNQL